MSDDCETEIDILGDCQLDFRPISNSLELPELQTTNADLSNELSQNIWSDAVEHSQPWYLDHDMDRKSKLAIEQLLQEDSKISSALMPNDGGNDLRSIANLHKQLVPSPTHKKPWTRAEKDLFVQGLEIHGRKWTLISRHIGTRTTLQVKNFARQYIKNQEKSSSLKEEATHFPIPTSLSDTIVAVTTASSPFESLTTLESKADYDLKPSSYVVAEEIVRMSSKKVEADNDEDVEICEDGPENEDQALSPEDPIPLNPISTDELDLETVKEEPEDLPSSSDSYHNEERVKDEESFAIGSNPPDKEIEIDDDFISEEERKVHKEFFEGRPLKTPNRYLKIRTYTIDSWKKSKPNYLNKTSVRPGLKNCGDVNCIGRIHEYLEQIGAINFGCEQARYSRPWPMGASDVPKEKPIPNKMVVAQLIRTESARPRKRRQPGYFDEFSVGEGYTMQHDVDGAVVDTFRPPTNLLKSKQSKKTTDPFKLVPCVQFSDESPAPYGVEVNVEAAIIADIHCHTVHSEVMGLLGGKYDVDANILKILTCEACDSTSTGFQCEMDPVSQTMAMEALQKSGYQIVGWYHSHPTFVPDPSHRDIETQVRYQELFENQSQNPFLATIISPFCRATNTSIIRYLIVETDQKTSPPKQVPRSFPAKLAADSIDVAKILRKADAFFSQSSNGGFQVEMMSPMASSSDVTYLDALLNSLEQKLEEVAIDQEIIKEVLLGINKLVIEKYSQPKL